MQRYTVKGEIRIEYTWYIDQELEAESEEDAIDAVCDDLDPTDSLDSHTDTYNLKIEEVEDEETPEDRRMRALGTPMLPGLA